MARMVLSDFEVTSEFLQRCWTCNEGDDRSRSRWVQNLPQPMRFG